MSMTDPETTGKRFAWIPAVKAWQLSLLASVFIVAADNYRLVGSVTQKLDIATAQGLGFVLTLCGLMTAILTVLFLCIAPRAVQKAAIVFVIFVSAILGYFTQSLGVVFSPEMFANIVATFADRNVAEGTELISLDLAWHLLLFAALPAALVLKTPVVASTVPREFFSRLACGAACLFTVLLLGFFNYRYVTYFSEENKDLRMLATPFYALVSLNKYVNSKDEENEETFIVLGRDARQVKSDQRRIVGVLVVGETARSDHFSLNGYGRDTNPMLEHDGVVSFPNVSACGTSTEYSVPCMFFLRGRDNYTPEHAQTESNLLDVLGYAGVDVAWIENNSTCKNVCDHVQTVDLRKNPDTKSAWYSDHGYYDDAMVGELQRITVGADRDQLIVLHTIGSHGPAYSRRYPDGFAMFTPYCSDKSPLNCTSAEVNNAYDNTILYTDHFLDELITLLQSHAADFDSFLLYASDHGESLGEKGVYLHGLPYDIAPDAQKKVPFIAWFSDRYAAHHDVGPSPEVKQGEDLSHDFLPHSLLGLFEVQTSVYRRDYDIFRQGG